MLNFSDFDIPTITNFLSDHNQWVFVFTYLIVFAESMAVIGAIVPGAIVMPAIGFLIGSAVIPAGTTFMWGALGAITGDCLSYFIGVYFQDRIHRIWPFTKWPNLVEHSEKFFNNHGGKSIFIGRFMGPTRAMIPMVAGMLKMPFLRFLFVALPSAAAWTVSYMIPGILLGALSLELPPTVAAKFALWALLVGIVLWVMVWALKHYFKQIWQMIDYYIMQSWKYFKTHKSSSWVTKFLSDPKEPDNHHQLGLIVQAVLMFSLFLFVLNQVLTNGFLVDWSRVVYHLLTSVRSLVVDNIFLLFTFFGDLQVILGITGIICLWLWFKKHKHAAIHLLGAIVLAGGALGVFKLFMYSPRPGGILYDMYTSSFPSAHSVLSTVFYGFLAVIIARELKDSKRYLPYINAAVLISLVAFSRIYLGAHWLGDVLAGIFLGLSVLLLVTVSYRRRHDYRYFPVYKFNRFAYTAILMIWIGYGLINFDDQSQEYELIWPEQAFTLEQIVNKKADLPLYRLNRLGRPIEAFNVIYIGDLDVISKSLESNGWKEQPIMLDFQQMIQSFASGSVIHHLTVFPQIYHNERMSLLFAKATKHEDVVLLLRLWPSDIDLKNSSLSLWIGTVEYHQAMTNSFSLRRFRTKNHFMGATKILAKSIGSNFYLWRNHYSIKQQPQEMKDLHWDGRQLVIKSKELD